MGKNCKTRKVGYRLKVEALSRAKSVEGWYGTKMRVYRCPTCKMWHTSRAKDG